MRQKFRRFSFVRVCEEMPLYMRHFESGFDAIVDGTYSQIYSGHDIKSYALYQLEDGEIINHISWYQEDQLTALEEKDRDKAEELIEAYNLSPEE